MNLEIIERDSRKFVLVPIEQFNRVLEDLETLEDIRDFEIVKNLDEEAFPSDVVDRLVLNNENPIKVFREYRGLTQEQLAEKTGIQPTDLATMETGQKSGSVKSLKLIAEALNLDVDLISIS